MLNIHQFTFNLFREHAMVAWKDSRECVIVDPGFYDDGERAEFFGFIESNGLKPAAALMTHGHMDHIFGLKEVQDRYGIPVYMSKDEADMLEYHRQMAPKLGLKAPEGGFEASDISDGQLIHAAGMQFKVIMTPGHSPGGACYLDEEDRIMFTGDTLFAGTIGRTDLMNSDYDKLIVSIMDKLMILDGDIRIYPGHGPASDIATERMQNPFLEPFNEKEEEREED